VAWIKTISVEDAKGELQREYAAAIARAGRVWNIVKLMSLNPHTMRASMGVYLSAMHGPSALTRAQREMLAVVVSKTNGCHY
jgi:alkylhydroperoxidase family enzyme